MMIHLYNVITLEITSVFGRIDDMYSHLDKNHVHR